MINNFGVQQVGRNMISFGTSVQMISTQNVLVDSNFQNFISQGLLNGTRTIGLTVPGVIQELQQGGWNQFAEKLDVITLPTFGANQITVYEPNAINQGIEYLWSGGGTTYFNRGHIVTNHSVSNVPVQYVASTAGQVSYVTIEGYAATATTLMCYDEISAISDYVSKIRRAEFGYAGYFIGAVIKMKSGEYYYCRREIANPRHKGDFQLFLAATLYRYPVCTEDKKLQKDLDRNGLRFITHTDRILWN